VQNKKFTFGSNSDFSLQMIAGSVTDVDINSGGQPDLTKFFPPPIDVRGKAREVEYGHEIAKEVLQPLEVERTVAADSSEENTTGTSDNVLHVPSVFSTTASAAVSQSPTSQSPTEVSDKMKAMLAALKQRK
jgi:hypothetical protein